MKERSGAEQANGTGQVRTGQNHWLAAVCVWGGYKGGKGKEVGPVGRGGAGRQLGLFIYMGGKGN